MATATSTQVPGPTVTQIDLVLASAEASALLAMMSFIAASSAPAAYKTLAGNIVTALNGAGVS